MNYKLRDINENWVIREVINLMRLRENGNPPLKKVLEQIEKTFSSLDYHLENNVIPNEYEDEPNQLPES